MIMPLSKQDHPRTVDLIQQTRGRKRLLVSRQHPFTGCRTFAQGLFWKTDWRSTGTSTQGERKGGKRRSYCFQHEAAPGIAGKTKNEPGAVLVQVASRQSARLAVTALPSLTLPRLTQYANMPAELNMTRV